MPSRVRPVPVPAPARVRSLAAPTAPAAARIPARLSDEELYPTAEQVAANRFPSDVREVMVWICRCYRKTGSTLTIDDVRPHVVLDNAVPAGGFGYMAGHRGEVESWRSEFTGQGLRKTHPGLFEMEIPHGTAGLVHTLLEAEEFRRWGVNASVGVAVPNGRFAGAVNSGGSESFGLEYRLDPMFALEAELSAAEFRKGAGGSDATFFGTKAGARAYFLDGPIRPYAEAGLGFYAGSPGRDGVGLDFGIGVRYRLTDQVGLTAGYRFQEVFVAGVDPCWSTIELGVSLRF